MNESKIPKDLTALLATEKGRQRVNEAIAPLFGWYHDDCGWHRSPDDTPTWGWCESGRVPDYAGADDPCLNREMWDELRSRVDWTETCSPDVENGWYMTFACDGTTHHVGPTTIFAETLALALLACGAAKEDKQ